MQKGHRLHFKCKDCQEPIQFSVFELEAAQTPLCCTQCQKHYVLSDETLVRQIKKFEQLCKAICESEEILSNTSVGVDVGSKQVQIPYKLLLTRLSSSLDLNIEGEPISIFFRIEPCKDTPSYS